MLDKKRREPAGKGRATAGDGAADQTTTLTEERRSGSDEPIVGPGGAGGVTPPADRDRRDAGSPLPLGDPDRYGLVSEHARGGLGRILRARDRHLGRTVAVKELLVRSPHAEARFVREAMITSRLQHPGVVPVHEAGRWPSGEPYYVMKLISGSTLKERIAECADFAARLALLPHVIAVAETVGYAHARSIIHRDLKPSNVVVGEFGETVVVDWGLAKDLDDGGEERRGGERPVAARADTTSDSDVVGTPAYMAPEQARGESVGRRADVYSLGALLYHVLAGAAPYAGSGSDDRVGRVLEGPPPPIAELVPEVPTDLAAIVDLAMSRNPWARYPSAKELAEDLKRFQTGKLVTAHDYSTVGLLRRWLRRHRGAVAAALLAVVAAAGLGAYAVRRIVSERDAAQSQRAQARRAQRASEERSAELLFTQASSSLRRDPTAAVAWLKQYPRTGRRYDQVADMIEEARSLGVARHVFVHGDWVHTIAFAAGDRLISGSKDGRIMVWNLQDGAGRLLASGAGEIRVVTGGPGGRVVYGDAEGHIVVLGVDGGEPLQLAGHRGAVTRLEIYDGGARLLSAGDDRTVRLWDLERGVQLRVIEPAFDGSAGALSDDATHLAELGPDGRLRLYDVERDRWREERIAPLPPSQKLALDRAGARLAAVDAAGHLRLVDLGRGRVTEVGEHPGLVDYLAFSPSGRLLVSAGSDKVIRVWNLAGGDNRVLRGHDDAIYEVDFDPDERRLVSASDDGTARIWDLDTGVVSVLRGHRDDVFRARFSPDGSLVATGSLDGTVRVWPARFAGGRVLSGHRDSFVASVRALGHGAALSQSLGGELIRWDLESGAPTRLGKVWPGKGYPDWKRRSIAAVSRDGRRAAAARADGKVDLVDLESGERRVLEAPGGAERIGALAFAPAGDHLAASDKRRVIEWPLGGGGGAARVTAAPGIAALAYTDGGALLMSGLGVAKIRRRGGEVIDIPVDRDFAADRVAAARGGRRVAAIDRRAGRVVVFDPDSGARHALDTGGDTLMDVAFSPDGARLAGAGADRRVRLWDIESGAVRVLAGHSDLVHDVEFSPDGSLLASSSYDKTIRLWPVDGGRPRVLRGHGGSVDGISFTPDGSRLLSASRDGTVRIWKVDEGGLDAGAIGPTLEALTTAEIDESGTLRTPRP